MEIGEVKYNCKHFRGHIPCAPNKLDGSLCNNCKHFEPIEKRMLIIKLGAIGDVIRTTPLIEAYRSKYKNLSITWLSQFPDVLPLNSLDEILKIDEISLFTLAKRKFDLVINLDKEEEACQLLAAIDAPEKYGYSWKNGHVFPATPAAEHKLLTGFFDSLSKTNTKSYLAEIFEICHLSYQHEPYQIRINPSDQAKWKSHLNSKAKGKKVIGLNTGCGPRWKTRLWSEEAWVELTKNLENQGYFCMLLGGEAEHQKNQKLANETGAFYPGHFSLEEFIALSDSCDLIVSQVSLMMHIAIALQKKLILMNNIFNPHEFELFGRGEIVQPTSGCDCYYGSTCTRPISCMNDISVSMIESAIQSHLPI